MTTIDDLRELALAMPQTTEKLAWGNAIWRVACKIVRLGRPLGAKDRAELPDTFYHLHFDRGLRLLARLDVIDRARLREIVEDAWLARAPETLVREYLA